MNQAPNQKMGDGLNVINLNVLDETRKKIFLEQLTKEHKTIVVVDAGQWVDADTMFNFYCSEGAVRMRDQNNRFFVFAYKADLKTTKKAFEELERGLKSFGDHSPGEILKKSKIIAMETIQ